MSQSNRFNYSNKQRYVNNQHIIRKLNTRTIYKKEDYYKDNGNIFVKCYYKYGNLDGEVLEYYKNGKNKELYNYTFI